GGGRGGRGKALTSRAAVEAEIEAERHRLRAEEPAGAEEALVKCALCAGLFPQVVRLARFRDSGKKRSGGRVGTVGGVGGDVLKLVQADCTEVALHQGSLLSGHLGEILDAAREGAGSEGEEEGERPAVRTQDAFLVYYKRMVSGRLFLYDATVVPHAALLLFSSAELQLSPLKGVGRAERKTVGGPGRRLLRARVGWIEVQVSELHAILYQRLQREVESLLRARVAVRSREKGGGVEEQSPLSLDQRQRNLRKIVLSLMLR
ncbi:hypothetical protein B484DRAFT_208799, partial [Ochromonadaceae sp. CCMP2298]